MSQISTAIFGAMAVSLTVGAVQFASGHDLTGGLGTGLSSGLSSGLGTGLATTVAATAQTSINRAAKADRAAAVVAASRNVPPAPLLTKPADRKQTVACEPMVSILTEIAKLLQPGRCVT